MGGCCVMDRLVEIVDDVVSALCFWDSDCGYHPDSNCNEQHATKIANELAEMKEHSRESSEKLEQEIMEYINRSANHFLDELEKLNHIDFGGTFLNLNIQEIRDKNAQLSDKVKGHIGNVIDDRLVLTDRELSIILKERDDKKRAKNFDNFVEKVREDAVKSLKDTIKTSVSEQSRVIEEKIQVRLSEVEKKKKQEEKAYTEILNSTRQGEVEKETTQIKYIYRYELFQRLYEQLSDEVCKQ
jgi:hypothetical protein